MPDLIINTSAADAFSWASLSFFFLFVLLCIVSLIKCLHLHVKIQQFRSSHLSYFNGPWITRILLTLISILLSIGEVLRTSLVKRKLFTDLAAQENVCKGYLVFNLGFAEPCILFGFVFLLRASLQQRDSGALSRRWNVKTIRYMLLLCIPALVWISSLVFLVPKLTDQSGNQKLPKSFTRTSLSVGEGGTKEYLCMYPVLVTISLAVIELILICNLGYKGCVVFKEAVNRRLKNRVACIGFWVPSLSLIRLLLLGFSVMPHPGSFWVQLMTFSAFLTSLCGISIGILILVFYPVNDALVIEWELGQNGRTITELLPYDDYYSDGASLIGNRSYLDLERNSETSTSTKQGSISFRTMVGSEGMSDDLPGYFRAGLLSGSPSSSSPSSVSRPMLPLREVPSY